MKKNITISVDIDTFNRFKEETPNVSDTINNFMNDFIGNDNKIEDLKEKIKVLEGSQEKNKEKNELGLCPDQIGFLRNRKKDDGLFDRKNFNDMRIYRGLEPVTREEYKILVNKVWTLYGKKFGGDENVVVEKPEQENRESQIHNG